MKIFLILVAIIAGLLLLDFFGNYDVRKHNQAVTDCLKITDSCPAYRTDYWSIFK